MDRMEVSTSVSDQQRVLPSTTMQLAGHATSAVVEGLSTNRAPWMLGIVILNVLGIAAAVYFLNVLITGQQIHLKALLETQQQQTSELLKMHKEEFDSLLEMARSSVASRLPAEPFPRETTAPGREQGRRSN